MKILLLLCGLLFVSCTSGATATQEPMGVVQIKTFITEGAVGNTEVNEFLTRRNIEVISIKHKEGTFGTKAQVVIIYKRVR